MTVISRHYQADEDLNNMIMLVTDLRRAGQRVYPNATDLYEELADPEVQITAQLWEMDSHLVGFAYINQYQNMVDVFDQSHFMDTLEREMMSWLVEAARHRNEVKGETQTLDASALEDDLQRQAFLGRWGFARQEESSILMGRPLDLAIPAAVIPPDFSIRPMGGIAEIEAYVDLHRAAFGTDHMTTSYRQSIMSAPGYIPGLDLVAVAPDGRLAAFCVCQIFPDDAPRAGGQREGWTDPVGTHPDYQGLGLAKALMLTGLGLLKERGMDTAVLGTSSTNTAMQKLAEGIGFRKVSCTLWYCKEVG